MVKSPVISVVRPKQREAPMAVETVPSMPFKPRFANTVSCFPPFR